MVLHLSQSHEQQIKREARAGYPHEVCGLLIGRVTRDGADVIRCASAPNVTDGDPRRRFSIAPQFLIDTQRRLRQEGLAVIGVYHSHPNQPPQPSQTDVTQGWPGLYYVICQTEPDSCGPLTAWCLHAQASAFEQVTISTSPAA
ncbi:MAG: M67 family metallopeptidase [Planctomycetes bacterium]|nr:M67 family metallopeptidase [Planctomycetota bacterium]